MTLYNIKSCPDRRPSIGDISGLVRLSEGSDSDRCEIKRLGSLPGKTSLATFERRRRKKPPKRVFFCLWRTRRDYSALRLNCTGARSLRSPAFFRPPLAGSQTRFPVGSNPPVLNISKCHLIKGGICLWRTRRDSNPRPSASEADTLSN